MHTIFNHRVEIDADGEHARGEVCNIAYLFSDGSERRLSTWYGRYLDTYERRGDEWRILHRVCVHHGDTEPSSSPTRWASTPPSFVRRRSTVPPINRPIGP